MKMKMIERNSPYSPASPAGTAVGFLRFAAVRFLGAGVASGSSPNDALGSASVLFTLTREHFTFHQWHSKQAVALLWT